jgi:hypothetical protein
MANVHINPQVITDMAALVLGKQIGQGFMKNMSKNLTEEFAKKTYKVGDSVNFYKAYRFEGTSGIGYQPQPVVDVVGTATVDQVAGVHFQWGIIEKTLEVREAMELYVEPVVAAIRGKIAPAAALYCTQNAFNSAGTPGTAPTGPLTYLTAKDILVELGLDESKTPNLVVNRRMSSAFVNGTTSFFNPMNVISGQLKEGQITDALMGAKIFRDQACPVVTNGVYAGTPLVNGAQSADGGNNATMTLNTDGWSSTTLNPNTKFTIGSASSATVGGVNSVHPQTRQDTGRQQVFSVKQDITDTTGTINMLIAPAITPSGQHQNVTTAAVDNAIITVIGTSGQSMQQGIMMDDNAFGFLSVPMQKMPEAGVQCYVSTDPITGFSLMHTMWSNGADPNVGMSINHRWDTLYGFYSNLPETATVIQA